MVVVHSGGVHGFLAGFVLIIGHPEEAVWPVRC